MTRAADTVTVVSLDEGTYEPDESSRPDYSAEPGTTEEPKSRPQTAPDRSAGPPPVRPTLW